MLCNILGIVPNDSTIRLVGGSSHSEWRVEVLYNGIDGEQYVVMDGTMTMPMLFVGHLGLFHKFLKIRRI